MLDQIIQATADRAWWLAIAMACCLVFELAIPGEKQTVAWRIRGTLFMCCYLALGVTLCTATLLALGRLGYAPLFTLDLTGTPASHNLLVRAFGYTIAPFAALLWSEALYYWFHRLQHAIPALWRLHSVHHSIAELNAVNSYHHISEELLRVPIVIIPIVFLVQVHAPTFAVILFLFRIGGQLAHANSRVWYGPLRYLWAEPRYHRIHHSIEPQHMNRNFSTSLPVIDWIFGTMYMPRRDEYPPTGVAGRPEPRSLRQYLLPPPVLSAERLQEIALASR